jgi:hypothetical protein
MAGGNSVYRGELAACEELQTEECQRVDVAVEATQGVPSAMAPRLDHVHACAVLVFKR